MKKAEIIEHWKKIKPRQVVDIQSVAYKHKGSTYDEDGIRITGSKQFIDSVLSNLKDLLNCENDNTRLQLVYKRSTDNKTGNEIDGYNCYIQVHERGGEAQMMNAFISGIKNKDNSYQVAAENMMSEALR